MIIENVTRQQAQDAIANMRFAPAPPGMGEGCILPVEIDRTSAKIYFDHVGEAATISRVNYAIAHGEAPLVTGCLYRNTCGSAWCMNPEHAARVDDKSRLQIQPTLSDALRNVSPKHRKTLRNKAATNAVWDGGCLVSTYTTAKVAVYVNGRMRYAPQRQAAWEYYANHLCPAGVVIVVSCGNKKCVNPKHLVAKVVSRLSAKALKGLTVLPRLAERVYNAKPAVPRPKDEATKPKAAAPKAAPKPAPSVSKEEPVKATPTIASSKTLDGRQVLTVLKEAGSPVKFKTLQRQLAMDNKAIIRTLNDLEASGVIRRRGNGTLFEYIPDQPKTSEETPVKYVKTVKTQVNKTPEPASATPGRKTVFDIAAQVKEYSQGRVTVSDTDPGLREQYEFALTLVGRKEGEATTVTLGELREFTARVARGGQLLEYVYVHEDYVHAGVLACLKVTEKITD